MPFLSNIFLLHPAFLYLDLVGGVDQPRSTSSELPWYHFRMNGAILFTLTPIQLKVIWTLEEASVSASGNTGECQDDAMSTFLVVWR